jgi:hypothetical protein
MIKNCLLSEFNDKGWQWLPDFAGACWALATLPFLGAVVILFLGHLARTNALCVRVDATVNVGLAAPTHTLLISLSHAYGYLNELAHGLFYLVFAPLFVWFGCAFVKTADKSLADLQKNGRLCCRAPGKNALGCPTRIPHRAGNQSFQ